MTEIDELPDESIYRLGRDLKRAAATLTPNEARYLVDAYYTMQKQRIRAAHQARTSAEDGEPHLVIDWFLDRSRRLEGQVRSALDVYSANDPDGAWLRGVVGIGPVIAAGLLAHLSFEITDHVESCTPAKRAKSRGRCDCTGMKRIQTVGHWWRFAGLDPTVVWKKSEKRPWNASLKTLCWKAGESFKKNSGREGCFYGRIYRERKQYEVDRNERGGNAACAAATIQAKKIRDPETRATYEAGRLPAGRLDLRATRYAVKLLLSHYHEAGYVRRYGEKPPLPYPIQHLGHVDKIEPPRA